IVSVSLWVMLKAPLRVTNAIRWSLLPAATPDTSDATFESGTGVVRIWTRGALVWAERNAVNSPTCCRAYSSPSVVARCGSPKTELVGFFAGPGGGWFFLQS